MTENAERAELPDEIYTAINVLRQRGDECLQAGDATSAYTHYREAWSLLPEPATKWKAGLWLIAAMGDTMFASGDFHTARDLFQQAVQHYGGLGNPYVHLRLGTCAQELGDLDRAADELIHAFSLAGAEIFSEDDQKYYAFLKTRAEPPMINGVQQWP